MTFGKIILAAAMAGLALPALSLPLSAQEPSPRERTRDSVRVRVEPRVGTFSFPSAMSARRAVIGVALSGGTEGDTAGVRVEEVTEGGPADRAGIEPGDRIVGVNGKDVRLTRSEAADEAQRGLASRRITRALGELSPGDDLTLRVSSNGSERNVQLRVVSPMDLARVRTGGDSTSQRWLTVGRNDRPVLGLTLQATGTARDTLGAFVASVSPDGPAEKAGIYEGDRIVSINGTDLRVRPVDAGDRYVAQLKAGAIDQAMENAKVGEAMDVRVWRAGQVRSVRVTPAPASEVQGSGMAMQLFGAPAAMFRSAEFSIPGEAFRVWSDSGPAAAFQFRSDSGPGAAFRVWSDSGPARVFRFEGRPDREVIIEIDPEMRGQIGEHMERAMRQMRRALEEVRRSSVDVEQVRQAAQLQRAQVERAREASQLRRARVEQAREAAQLQRTQAEGMREALQLQREGVQRTREEALRARQLKQRSGRIVII